MKPPAKTLTKTQLQAIQGAMHKRSRAIAALGLTLQAIPDDQDPKSVAGFVVTSRDGGLVWAGEAFPTDADVAAMQAIAP